MSPRTEHQPPRARPAATTVAVLLALALVAVAVVAVRDLGVDRGWVHGSAWSRDLVASLDGRTADGWWVAGGVAVALVGLLLVVAAVRPGRRTHLRATGDADLWLSPAALGALAQTAADRAPGVISAEATRTGRRRVTVEVVAREGDESVGDAARAAVAAGPGALTAAAVDVRLVQVPR